MDEVFRQAIEAAKRLFPEGIWVRLSPGEQTAAIYREMRRIDAERAASSESECDGAKPK